MKQKVNHIIKRDWVDRLKSLRVARGFDKQAALAKALDVSQSTYSRWENPYTGHFPDADELLRLCVVLETWPYYLLTGLSEPSAREGEAMALRRKYERYVSEADYRAAVDLITDMSDEKLQALVLLVRE